MSKKNKSNKTIEQRLNDFRKIGQPNEAQQRQQIYNDILNAGKSAENTKSNTSYQEKNAGEPKHISTKEFNQTREFTKKVALFIGIFILIVLFVIPSFFHKDTITKKEGHIPQMGALNQISNTIGTNSNYNPMNKEINDDISYTPNHLNTHKQFVEINIE